MRRPRAISASLFALTTLAASASAHAQDVVPMIEDTPRPSTDTPPPVVPPLAPPVADIKPSRLLPPPPPPGTPAPPINIEPPRAPGPRAPEVIPDVVSNERIVELAKLCQEVVPPNFDIQPQLLWENGWAYTPRVPFRSGSMIGDRVDYSRPGTAETIALIDLGPVVICRPIVRIESPEAIADMRAALIEGLSAQPFLEAPVDERYKQLVLANTNDENHPNVLVTDLYSIELTTETTDLTRKNVVGADSLTLLMAEMLPLPPNLRPQP